MEHRQDPRDKDELERLEELAGLSQTMKITRTGADPPAGVPGEHATHEEYVAQDYDRRRGATRDAYFSVADTQRRKQLIALSRKLDGGHRQLAQEQIEAAARAVSQAESGLQRQPWGRATLLGAALVAFGFWTSQGTGAIAGAAAALFLALGIMANARNHARLRLARAMHKLARAKKERDDHSLFPEVFSSHEEASGQRDTDFDPASAYRNLLHERENQQ
jgi:hypothetical protein